MFIIIIFILDSHHKLVRWRLITHGGIDGYSRLILYLKCASNIRCATVYQSFLEAVEKYHLPSRVRSDQGGENVLVAQHMIQNRGADRNSMIVGSSVHNQRIERLWKDVHKSVTSLFYKLFYFMEQNDLLHPLEERDLFALTFHVLTELSLVLRQVGIIILFALLKINRLTCFLVLGCFSFDILDSQHWISLKMLI